MEFLIIASLLIFIGTIACTLYAVNYAANPLSQKEGSLQYKHTLVQIYTPSDGSHE